MPPTFEVGVALGQALGQLQSHEVRIGRLEADVGQVKALAIRGVLLALLWTGALLVNLPATTVGEFTASFLRAWSK